jgi:hypothetical protein
MSLMVPATAFAECEEAERLRLADEAKKLAQRNAWSGVERAYTSLLETKCVLTFDDHFLGAQSARYLGKTFEMYTRLGDARALDQRSEIIENMEAIDMNYGRVDLRGDARFRPELTREAMPFAPDQRKSIEWAQEVIANTGSFNGMLPKGEYGVGGTAFAVEAGEEFQVIEVGKIKGRDEDQPLINYAHIVASVGPHFLLTGEPGDPTLDSNEQHQFAPATVFTSGFAVQLGTELGLTYRSPEAGIAFTLGYSGGFGNDTVHTFKGWAAGVLRPGEWRLALGPTYTVLTGQGTGVAGWFDRGQDGSRDPADAIRYQGFAYGPGAEWSAGYGVLDLDKLRGVVELGSAWQYDGSRSYFGFGLRVGIVPTVPRFEG